MQACCDRVGATQGLYWISFYVTRRSNKPLQVSASRGFRYISVYCELKLLALKYLPSGKKLMYYYCEADWTYAIIQRYTSPLSTASSASVAATLAGGEVTKKTETCTHTHMERERRAMMTMSHNATHVTDSRSSSPHSTASVLTDPSIHSLTPPTSVRQLTSLPHCFSFRILYSSFIICLPHNIRPNSPFGIARRKPFRAILAVLNMIIHAN